MVSIIMQKSHLRHQPRTLVITKSDRIPSGLSSIVVFSYPDRPVVAAVGQEIIQFPARDEAYALVEIK